MRRAANKARVIMFVVAGISAIAVPAISCDDACVEKLLQENEAMMDLHEYRDTEEMLRIKVRHMDLINEYRREVGSGALKYDLLAGRVANMQAKNAAEKGYGGHWDAEGRAPFLRYGLNGGLDHVSENAYEKTTIYSHYKGKSIACSMNDVDLIASDLKEATEAFLNEASGGKHRETVLENSHNYFGAGYYCEPVISEGRAEFRVRYYEEYVNRYIDFDKINDEVATGEKVTIGGTVIPDDAGVYIISVYYLDEPGPLTAEQINGMPGYYRDYTDRQAALLGPAEISFNPKRRSFAFEFQPDKKGYYYVQTLLREGYSTPTDGSSAAQKVLSPEDFIYASGIVIHAE